MLSLDVLVHFSYCLFPVAGDLDKSAVVRGCKLAAVPLKTLTPGCTGSEKWLCPVFTTVALTRLPRPDIDTR